MTFEELELIEPIQKALRAKGYTQPTEIQERSIPILLEGKDLLGCAQTGTGKTAAFAIPILQHLYNKPRSKGRRKIKALVITPTRELALQIAENFTMYGRYTGLKNTVIFGGVKQGAQTEALRTGVDILVATPGRLLDLISQGFISLKDIEYFVLDEADQMLDMGFIHDIRKVLQKLPAKRQSLFFSATMPVSIADLSTQILGKYESIKIQPEQATAEKVGQSLYYVSKQDKPKLLIHIIKENPVDSTLVFSRTKHGADKIVRVLKKAGINAEAIHGNKSQGARQRALGNFKSRETNVLIATDIAARGIDVSQLSLVINFDLPNIPETYVHRIGRTGRAKASGDAISFCAVDERPYLKDVQRLINQTIPVVKDHPFPDDGSEVPEKPTQRPQRRNSGQRSGKPGRNSSGGTANRNRRNAGDSENKNRSRNSRNASGGNSNRGKSSEAGKSKRRRPFSNKQD